MNQGQLKTLMGANAVALQEQSLMGYTKHSVTAHLNLCRIDQLPHHNKFNTHYNSNFHYPHVPQQISQELNRRTYVLTVCKLVAILNCVRPLSLDVPEIQPV